MAGRRARAPIIRCGAAHRRALARTRKANRTVAAGAVDRRRCAFSGAYRRTCARGGGMTGVERKDVARRRWSEAMDGTPCVAANLLVPPGARRRPPRRRRTRPAVWDAWFVLLRRAVDDGWSALSDGDHAAGVAPSEEDPWRGFAMLRAVGAARWRTVRPNERERLAAAMRRVCGCVSSHLRRRGCASWRRSRRATWRRERRRRSPDRRRAWMGACAPPVADPPEAWHAAWRAAARRGSIGALTPLGCAWRRSPPPRAPRRGACDAPARACGRWFARSDTGCKRSHRHDLERHHRRRRRSSEGA